MTTARSSLLRAVVIAVGPERLAPPHGDPHGLANNGLTRWPAGGHSDLDPANHTGLYDDLTHEYHLQMISPSGGSTVTVQTGASWGWERMEFRAW